VLARGGARRGAGRKKARVSEAKRELAEMAKDHAEAALRTLVEIATGDGAASARVSTKPSQAVDLSDSQIGHQIIVSWRGEALPERPEPE